MRKTGRQWRCQKDDTHQLNGLVENIREQWAAGKDVNLAFMEAERSDSQNSLIYSLYGDIARQSQDKTVGDVRKECKLTIGIAILKAADPVFSDWYDKSIKPLAYEDKLLLMGYMELTSLFSKSQASEYITEIISTYTNMGYSLADPNQEQA